MSGPDCPTFQWEYPSSSACQNWYGCWLTEKTVCIYGTGIDLRSTVPRTSHDAKVMQLVAYRVSAGPHMRIVPATPARDWMTQTPAHFAERCLPLLVANQAGWFVLTEHAVRATWTGGTDLSALTIEHLHGEAPLPARSHFGSGVITWTLPFLFRTPPGYNLLVRGPANLPKDRVYPLEGIVETDWSPATFTMNWKMTRPGTVTFEADEPICMILPVARGELEVFDPEVRPIELDLALLARYRTWANGRADFLQELARPGSEAQRRGWQRDYFRGRGADGHEIEGHQTKLKLRSFRSV